MFHELNQKFSLRHNFQKFYESAGSILQTILAPLDYNHIWSVIETKAMKIKERNSSNLPLTSENQDWLRRQLKNIFYGYIYSYDFSKQKRILSKDEWAVLSDFRNNDSIIISKPDKGNGVVIDSRLDYLTKMKKLISDGTKFKQLKQNPTKSREENLSVYLRKLKKDGIIDDVTFHKIPPNGSSPGVLYGLPKVHKAGFPFRPIVSSVNTYNCNLPSYLVGILQPISTNQHTGKDHLVSQIGPKHINIKTE